MQRNITVRCRTAIYLSVLLLIYLACSGAGAQEQTRKNNLCFSPTDWVGKYPSESEANPRRNFFALPCVRDQLVTLLPSSERRILLSELQSESKIEQMGRFLIVARCEAHNCPAHHAMVIVDIDTGKLVVGIYLRTAAFSRTTWYSRDMDPLELPAEILSEFLARHGPG